MYVGDGQTPHPPPVSPVNIPDPFEVDALLHLFLFSASPRVLVRFASSLVTHYGLCLSDNLTLFGNSWTANTGKDTKLELLD